jgi:tetratricopeptide (TPR) repeat protein
MNTLRYTGNTAVPKTRGQIGIQRQTVPLKPVFRQPANRKVLFAGGDELVMLDTDTHAKDLGHFWRALNNFDKPLVTYVIKTSDKNPQLKKMSSVLSRLRKLNALPSNERPTHIAMPLVFDVPLLNLSDQMRATTPFNGTLTQGNINQHKDKVIDFLRDISRNPSEYREHIKYMDPNGQELEYVYPVIQEINKAVDKGISVYIAAGHPKEQAIKYLAEQRGLKPELYHYIATGEDIKGSIKALSAEVDEKNWYNLNLLTLSRATTVGITDPRHNKYIFSAQGPLVTRYELGTYNLAPVRSEREIVGYSFTDQATPHFFSNKFNRAKNIEKFVGLPLWDVLASESEHADFITNKNASTYENKLFKVEKVFSGKEINQKKLLLQGTYVDSSKTLFFETNKDGQVIFPKVDCEGSGRPSITAMWGTCFSVIKALADDVRGKIYSIRTRQITVNHNNGLIVSFLNNMLGIPNQEIRTFTNHPRFYKDFTRSERSLSLHGEDVDIWKKSTVSEATANRMLDEAKRKGKGEGEAYIILGQVLAEKGKYKNAEDCFNAALEIYRGKRYGKFHTFMCSKRIGDMLCEQGGQTNYVNAQFCYGQAIKILKDDYQSFDSHHRTYSLNSLNSQFIELFDAIANICALQNKVRDAKICHYLANAFRYNDKFVIKSFIYEDKVGEAIDTDEPVRKLLA